MSGALEARRRGVLTRIDRMARTGGYSGCKEIEAELRGSPDYPLVRTYFDDPIFCAQLTQLCEEARREAMNYKPRAPE
jgi:hypothetical protein